MKIILETSRLIIREVVESDFSSLKNVISDPINMQYYPKPYNDEGVRRWINWCIASYKEHGFSLFSLELKDSHTYIGDCGFSIQNIDGEEVVELGYHLKREFQHQGYIYEASQSLIEYGFNVLGFQEIYSYMNFDNVPSRCVAIRNGMTFLKKYKEDEILHAVYRLTKKEWLNKKQDKARKTKFQKIILIGSPGSGKSYLSKKLSNILDYPLYHLDILFWKPGWSETTKEEFISKQKEVMKGDKWIIDGSYVSTLNVRLEKADTVIYFDIPIETCLKNEKERRGKPRTDLPSYSIEKEDPEFINYIKEYPNREMKLIDAYLFRYPSLNVIKLHNQEEIDLFLNSLKCLAKNKH